jgi:hypothetical protein
MVGRKNAITPSYQGRLLGACCWLVSHVRYGFCDEARLGVVIERNQRAQLAVENIAEGLSPLFPLQLPRIPDRGFYFY